MLLLDFFSRYDTMKKKGRKVLMTIGERIKAARKKAGLTQKQLGEKMGISYQAVAQWENDLRNPKIETLRAIANALGMPVSDLTGTVNEIASRMDQQALQAKQLLKQPAQTDFQERKRWAELLLTIDQMSEEADRWDAVNQEQAQAEISAALAQLNPTGQQEAVRRVKELTYIPEYRKKDTTKDGNPKEESPPE